MNAVRLCWFLFGFVCVALGALGIFLPFLPTTPFLLLAAFAFARSSQRWHNWLVHHRIFGPLIENWRQYGAIGKRTKLVSVGSMVAVLGLSIALKASMTVIIVQAIVLTCSGIFVLSRPLPPKT